MEKITAQDLEKLYQIVKIQTEKSDEAKEWKSRVMKYLEKSYSRRFKSELSE